MIRLESLQGRFIDHLRRKADFPSAWCAQGAVDSDTGLAARGAGSEEATTWANFGAP